MMKRRIIILIILLGFGLALWCRLLGSEKANNRFFYAGTLEVTKVTLSSKVATDIISFKSVEGNPVRKGEIIIKLNDDIYKIAANQLNNDYIRSLKLLHDGNISLEMHDRIEKAKKDNDLYIQWCEIKSPIDGTIITKFKEEGEFVSPGSNIVSIANTKNIWAYFYVEQAMINKLKIGQTVNCYLPTHLDKAFAGTIIKINEESEFTPKNVQTREERTRLVYGVKVQLDNENQELKPGMTLETAFE